MRFGFNWNKQQIIVKRITMEWYFTGNTHKPAKRAKNVTRTKKKKRKKTTQTPAIYREWFSMHIIVYAVGVRKNERTYHEFFSRVIETFCQVTMLNEAKIKKNKNKNEQRHKTQWTSYDFSFSLLMLKNHWSVHHHDADDYHSQNNWNSTKCVFLPHFVLPWAVWIT